MLTVTVGSRQRHQTHIDDSAKMPLCLGTPAARPCDLAFQKLLRPHRRPVKAMGWTRENGKAAMVTPVRGLPS